MSNIQYRVENKQRRIYALAQPAEPLQLPVLLERARREFKELYHRDVYDQDLRLESDNNEVRIVVEFDPFSVPPASPRLAELNGVRICMKHYKLVLDSNAEFCSSEEGCVLNDAFVSIQNPGIKQLPPQSSCC